MTAGKSGNDDARQPTPLSELDKALKGIIGTPKAEVDAEERKERRRKPQKRSSTRREHPTANNRQALGQP